MQKPKDSELFCTESLCWMDKDSLLQATGKLSLKHLCGCLLETLKMHHSPSFTGEIQPLTFLKLEFGRALLMVIQVRHCLVFALAVLLSVRGMTDFSEHWDNTSYPDDTQ